MSPSHAANLNSDNNEPLICQLSAGGWFLIGIWWLLGMGISLTASFAPGQISAGSRSNLLPLLVGMFWLPVAWGSWAMARRALIVDECGLTFVGSLRRRFVPWSAIEDYWIYSSQSSQSTETMQLQVAGKTWDISSNFDGQAELKARIERDAHWAKVRRFERRETRDDADWPKTFAYHDVSGWRILVTYLGFTLTLSILIFLKSASGNWSAAFQRFFLIWNGMSLPEKIGFAALQFTLCSAMGLVILARYPAIVTRRQWLGQSVIATPATLTFRDENNNAQTTIGFDEITDYYLESLPGHFQDDLCVVWATRRRLEFTNGIGQSKLLMRLIAERATRTQMKSWRHVAAHNDDILGGEASLWRNGLRESGPKIYHYRTRFNRIFLIFGIILSAAVWVRPLVGSVNGGTFVVPQTQDWAMAFVFSVLIGLPTLWGLCGWFFSAVESDQFHLRQRGIWGARTVRWDEIEQWGTKECYYFVRGPRTVLRFGKVADEEALLAELRRRAPQASETSATRSSQEHNSN